MECSEPGNRASGFLLQGQGRLLHGAAAPCACSPAWVSSALHLLFLIFRAEAFFCYFSSVSHDKHPVCLWRASQFRALLTLVPQLLATFLGHFDSFRFLFFFPAFPPGDKTHHQQLNSTIGTFFPKHRAGILACTPPSILNITYIPHTIPTHGNIFYFWHFPWLQILVTARRPWSPTGPPLLCGAALALLLLTT